MSICPPSQGVSTLWFVLFMGPKTVATSNPTTIMTVFTTPPFEGSSMINTSDFPNCLKFAICVCRHRFRLSRTVSSSRAQSGASAWGCAMVTWTARNGEVVVDGLTRRFIRGILPGGNMNRLTVVGGSCSLLLDGPNPACGAPANTVWFIGAYLVPVEFDDSAGHVA